MAILLQMIILIVDFYYTILSINYPNQTNMALKFYFLQNNELFNDAIRKSLSENEQQNLREVLEAMNRRVSVIFSFVLF